MSAALIELVSRGVQDTYTTSNPEVSFFRQNYKRYTNFAIKPERLDYIGTFGSNNEVTIPIRSKGDLLSYVWIEAANIGDTTGGTTGFFSKGDEPTEFSLWIGGQQVCRLDSLYIQGVHNLLYRPDGAKSSMAVTTTDVKANAVGYSGAKAGHYLIPFFFSEDWTKSLPLVALSNHQVEIRIKCRANFTPSETPKVYGTFIFCDTEEREFFVKTEHKLLINQVQFQPMSATDTEVDLSYFNHPTRAVHVVCSKNDGSNWAANYSFTESTLYINGTPLFDGTSNVYHHTIVPEMHTTSLPDDLLDTAALYTWPFALTLNKTQMTGSLNFSRIDTARLKLKSPSGGASSILRAYGVNMNVLRIKDGMGGVAFGN
jgi:hypothetical protein